MKGKVQFFKILFFVILSLTIFITFTGCGGGGGGGGGTTTYQIAEYFPLGQGDTWTSKDYEENYFSRTISGTETINGVVASKMLHEGGNYELITSDNNGLILYKEYSTEGGEGGWHQFVPNPPIELLPRKVSIGTKHTFNSSVSYTDSRGASMTATTSGELTIVLVEDVAVPAGTFEDCLKVEDKRNIISSDGKHTISSNFTYWLAKGVGIVKEVGQITETNDGSVVKNEIYDDVLVSATVGGINYPR